MLSAREIHTEAMLRSMEEVFQRDGRSVRRIKAPSSEEFPYLFAVDTYINEDLTARGIDEVKMYAGNEAAKEILDAIKHYEVPFGQWHVWTRCRGRKVSVELTTVQH